MTGNASTKELDSIVLERDLPEHRLRQGDLNAVVQIYSLAAFEIEFVRASGSTQALIQLSRRGIRPLENSDVPVVRPPAQCHSRGPRTPDARRELPQ